MQKTIVLTGASRGIGEVTARELAREENRLIILGRDEHRTMHAIEKIVRKTGNQDIHFIKSDLFDIESIDRALTRIKELTGHIDLLINNAGGVKTSHVLNKHGIEWNFMVNHLAPLKLTLGLEDLLRKAGSARVINVSSTAQAAGKINLDDLNGRRFFIGFLAYCNAKLAEIMQTYTFSERFNGTGITVNALHPGVVNTNFARDNGAFYNFAMTLAYPVLISPEKGAETTLYLATSGDVKGITGKYFARKKAVRSNPTSYDKTLRDQLWEKSMEMLHLH